MSRQQGAPPIKEFKAGNLRTAIWRNEGLQDGKSVVQHSIKLEKSYKDPRSGNWINIDITLFLSEVPDARLVLDRAFEYCRLRDGNGVPEQPSHAGGEAC